MAEFVYVMEKVRKAVGDKVILDDVYLSFYPGAKIGVVGPNGAGKSTVLKMMAGLDQPSNGTARLTPGFSVGILMQEPELDETKTVKENVEDGVRELMDVLKRYNDLNEKMGEPDADFDAIMAEQAPLMDVIEAKNGWEIDSLIEQAMDALRCPPPDEPVNHLSGGERRRVALCKLLLQAPDLLLLDEPTNHLDAESVEWLEKHLARYPGAVLAVTHDRYFLDNVAEWILELDRGKGIPWKGNYTAWLEQKSERLKQEESGEKARQKALAKELEWVRSNAKGGRTKGKARMARFEELNSVEYQRRNETNEIFIPPGERLGASVIEFNNVSKSFGDRLLIDNLSFIIPAGAIVGIIGPNGAGKSTLFKMITGQETPDTGTITKGPSTKIAYVDQSRDALTGNHNVFQEISGGADILNINGVEIQSRAYLGRFNFKGQDQQKLVGTLSGGERGRLHLAKTLLQGGNVLLLDEPSNDLDIETLRALEDALLEFPGCVVVISHDRWFLDRIATHILAFEGDSHVELFQGNYREYEDDKKRRLGEEGARPHRLRFKALK